MQRINKNYFFIFKDVIKKIIYLKIKILICIKLFILSLFKIGVLIVINLFVLNNRSININRLFNYVINTSYCKNNNLNLNKYKNNNLNLNKYKNNNLNLNKYKNNNLNLNKYKNNNLNLNKYKNNNLNLNKYKNNNLNLNKYKNNNLNLNKYKNNNLNLNKYKNNNLNLNKYKNNNLNLNKYKNNNLNLNKYKNNNLNLNKYKNNNLNLNKYKNNNLNLNKYKNNNLNLNKYKNNNLNLNKYKNNNLNLNKYKNNNLNLNKYKNNNLNLNKYKNNNLNLNKYKNNNLNLNKYKNNNLNLNKYKNNNLNLNKYFLKNKVKKQLINTLFDEFPKLKNIKNIKSINFIFNKNKKLKKIIWNISYNKKNIYLYKNNRFIEIKINKINRLYFITSSKQSIKNFFKIIIKLGIKQKDIKEILKITNKYINFRKLNYNDTFILFNISNKLNLKKNKLIGIKFIINSKEFYIFKSINGNFYNLNKFNIKKFIRFPTYRRYRVSSNFNLNRFNPITNRISPHKGIDIAMPIGTPILSISNGIVEINSNDKYAGNYIVIRHNKRCTTKYMHLKKSFVKKGQKVLLGDKIAISGNTGRSTGPHLHFEIWIDYIAVNPLTVKLNSILKNNNFNIFRNIILNSKYNNF